MRAPVAPVAPVPEERWGTKDGVKPDDQKKKERNQKEVTGRKRWKGSGKGGPLRPGLQCRAVKIAAALLAAGTGRKGV